LSGAETGIGPDAHGIQPGVNGKLRAWIFGWAVVAMGLALLLQHQPPASQLFLQMNRAGLAWPDSVWSFLTLLGEADILFVLLAPLLLWRPQAMLALLGAVPVGGALSLTLKALFDAPRPAAVLELAQFRIIGPVMENVSFPSGHTITAFTAFVAVLASVWPPAARHDPFFEARAGWATHRVLGAGLILAGGLACGVGLSRIAVGAHWPADVLAGASVGALAGLSGAWLAARFPVTWQSATSQTVIALVLGLIAFTMLRRPIVYPAGGSITWFAAASMGVAVLGLIWRWRFRVK
jgi:membrane-associated phospholipid phosphatase